MPYFFICSCYSYSCFCSFIACYCCGLKLWRVFRTCCGLLLKFWAGGLIFWFIIIELLTVPEFKMLELLLEFLRVKNRPCVCPLRSSIIL